MQLTIIPPAHFSFDQRRFERQALISRVVLLSSKDRAWYSVVKDISPLGLQVKMFGTISDDLLVDIRIGDEDAIAGRIAWVEQCLAGIEFRVQVDPETLLRIAQKRRPKKRRSLPRVNAMARALLRTRGRSYPVELRDISASGAKLRTCRIRRYGPTIILILPDLPPIKAFVRWRDREDLGIAFEVPLPIQVIAGWLDERVRVSG
jgi:hypothetical protein